MGFGKVPRSSFDAGIKKRTDSYPVQKSTPGAALFLPCHAKGKMKVDAARTQRPVLKKKKVRQVAKKTAVKHLR